MAEQITNIYAKYDTTLIHATGFKIRADELFDGDIEEMLQQSLREAESNGDPDHTRWAYGSYAYWLDQQG